MTGRTAARRALRRKDWRRSRVTRRRLRRASLAPKSEVRDAAPHRLGSEAAPPCADAVERTRVSRSGNPSVRPAALPRVLLEPGEPAATDEKAALQLVPADLHR